MKASKRANSIAFLFLLPAGAVAAATTPPSASTASVSIWVTIAAVAAGLLGTILLLSRCAGIQRGQNRDFTRMLNSISDAILRTDNDGGIVFINTAAEKITGWSAGEARGRKLNEVLNTQSRRPTKAADGEPMADESLDIRKTYRNALPQTLISRKGTTYKVTMYVYPVLKNGLKDGSLVVIRDVTEASLGHELLRETQKRFQSMFDNAPLLIAMTTLKGKIIFANKLFTSRTGYSQFKLSRMPLQEIVHPADYPRCREEYENILGGKSALSSFKIKLLNIEDHVIFVETTCLPLTRPNGKIKHILCMFRDISNEMTNEMVIRQEREQRRLIVENTNELILQLDRNYRITSCNRPTAPDKPAVRCADLVCHREEGDKRDCPDCPIHRALENGENCKKEMKTADRVLIVSASPLFDQHRLIDGAIIIIFDITEQRMMELQLLHAQKMDAIGKLAGGIAHDFNNLLQVILGYSDLLQKQINGESGLEMWQQVVDAGNSAKNLVRQLLTFSRKELDAELKRNDLNDIIRHFQKMIGRIIGENIKLELKLSAVPMMVQSDVGLLEQVMMNLCINARDAMPQGGLLTITTAVTPVADADGIATEQVCWEIIDTGCGIPEENLDRIFEPFFTTKPVDRGTGLGLSIVYSIVTKHNGTIKVDSHSGEGSTFRLYFPVSPEDTTDIQAETTAEIEVGPASPTNELILHVEDDPNVRKITRAILESEGYEVLEAANGSEGLKLFETNQNDIKAVLLDVILPGMPGKEIANRIHHCKPEMPVLFCSGYTNELVGLGPREQLLRKPFLKKDLIGFIKSSIQGENVGGVNHNGA